MSTEDPEISRLREDRPLKMQPLRSIDLYVGSIAFPNKLPLDLSRVARIRRTQDRRQRFGLSVVVSLDRRQQLPVSCTTPILNAIFVTLEDCLTLAHVVL
jgi:hypothetical protein